MSSRFAATALTIALPFLLVPPLVRRWERRTEKEILPEIVEEAHLAARD